MNMNWTEIKAAWGDCDSSYVFFFFFSSDKSQHPRAEQLSEANVTPGYNGIHPGCVTFTTIQTLTHTNLNDKRAGHTLPL